jgi:hypothetical protein
MGSTRDAISARNLLQPREVFRQVPDTPQEKPPFFRKNPLTRFHARVELSVSLVKRALRPQQPGRPGAASPAETFQPRRIPRSPGRKGKGPIREDTATAQGVAKSQPKQRVRCRKRFPSPGLDDRAVQDPFRRRESRHFLCPAGDRPARRSLTSTRAETHESGMRPPGRTGIGPDRPPGRRPPSAPAPRQCRRLPGLIKGL